MSEISEGLLEAVLDSWDRNNAILVNLLRLIPHHAMQLRAMEDSPSVAKIVRDAVRSRIETGRGMDLHYDHPSLFLQHMIWHEGYHHGQIKLALKLAGQPISNKEAGPVTWRVWMNKNKRS